MLTKALKMASVAVLAVIFIGCGTTTASIKHGAASNTPSSLNKELWELARDAGISAESTADKQQKAAIATEGMSLAKSCIMKMPEEAACYYYHAINTGLYYEAHVAGYQDGLKSMISDCKKVISLNQKLDHGGAYRILGKIYMEVPETTMAKNGVTRDMDKAIEYLQSAVRIDSSYPENQIYLTEALLEAGRRPEAREALNIAEAIVPQWKNHRDYAIWQKTNKKLSDKLRALNN